MVAEVTIPSQLQNADASGCKSIGDTYRQPPMAMVIYSTYPSKSAQQTAYKLWYEVRDRGNYNIQLGLGVLITQ